ncbi:hypothetical protein DACRYDRAFT_19988 [Dacryopinax primogenitus]|uniref:Small ribosomal subunit protein mS38 n=1 Tax=Dacryopinax primogenitus (strain DJM 731) TaxID=1858805 RepID=M5G5K2_DACPD|nr:uncharacterized protein DACRYDRAFT_19988 [Dacryopinax primogenitus]EJU05541.1 hypothetical protein DACRYDRAFT_19988 [Dacryopinax primogenitus]
MPFVPRLILRSRPPALRRSYSFLSNKQGRPWFKGAAAKQQQPQGQRQQAPTQQSSSVLSRDAQECDGIAVSVDGLTEGKPVTDVKTSASPLSTEAPPTSPSMSISIANALTWPSPTLPPTDHPQMSIFDLTVQRFYSINRPLFSIVLPVTPSATHPEEVDKEAEADAARLLARALVMSKLGAEKDWDDVIAKLEGRLEEENAYENVVSMDSVKRKRRKKMTKHKFKKRRRAQRAERQRLGK